MAGAAATGVAVAVINPKDTITTVLQTGGTLALAAARPRMAYGRGYFFRAVLLRRPVEKFPLALSSWPRSKACLNGRGVLVISCMGIFDAVRQA
jgi:hypothetical protein